MIIKWEEMIKYKLNESQIIIILIKKTSNNEDVANVMATLLCPLIEMTIKR